MPAGAVCLPTSASRPGCHSSGFLAGENPSRNHASARPSQPGRVWRASPRTRRSSRAGRVRGVAGSANASATISAKGTASGNPASARAASSGAIGKASKLVNRSGPWVPAACHARKAAIRFNPVPKPSSAICGQNTRASDMRPGRRTRGSAMYVPVTSHKFASLRDTAAAPHLITDRRCHARAENRHSAHGAAPRAPTATSRRATASRVARYSLRCCAAAAVSTSG